MTAVQERKTSSTVPLRWDEVFFTNCPMVSANNIDQELGWCREEFKKIDDGGVIVDVREPEEWQHGHVEGSVAAPRGLLEFFADPTSPRHKEALDPHKRTIVLCASGARAALAAVTLKSMGYDDVALLDGGLKGWVEAGLPTHEHEYAGI